MAKARYIIAVVVALIVGFVSAKYMAQGTPLVTIPWGIIALAIGLLFRSRKEALLLGGLFGFVTSYAYLWFDNASGKSPLLVAIIFLPAAFGLFCGLGVSWLGYLLNGFYANRR